MVRFVVIKRGVYIQDVHGPFFVKEDACAQAQQNAAVDTDSYHEHQVWVVTPQHGLLEQVATFRKFIPTGHRFSESNLMWGQAIKENKNFKVPF